MNFPGIDYYLVTAEELYLSNEEILKFHGHGNLYNNNFPLRLHLRVGKIPLYPELYFPPSIRAQESGNLLSDKLLGVTGQAEPNERLSISPISQENDYVSFADYFQLDSNESPLIPNPLIATASLPDLLPSEEELELDNFLEYSFIKESKKSQKIEKNSNWVNASRKTPTTDRKHNFQVRRGSGKFFLSRKKETSFSECREILFSCVVLNAIEEVERKRRLVDLMKNLDKKQMLAVENFILGLQQQPGAESDKQCVSKGANPLRGVSAYRSSPNLPSPSIPSSVLSSSVPAASSFLSSSPLGPSSFSQVQSGSPQPQTGSPNSQIASQVSSIGPIYYKKFPKPQMPSTPPASSSSIL